jgi:hypothetical protein
MLRRYPRAAVTNARIVENGSIMIEFVLYMDGHLPFQRCTISCLLAGILPHWENEGPNTGIIPMPSYGENLGDTSNNETTNPATEMDVEEDESDNDNLTGEPWEARFTEAILDLHDMIHAFAADERTTPTESSRNQP